jgi:hypothetical protein
LSLDPNRCLALSFFKMRWTFLRPSIQEISGSRANLGLIFLMPSSQKLQI